MNYLKPYTYGSGQISYCFGTYRSAATPELSTWENVNLQFTSSNTYPLDLYEDWYNKAVPKGTAFMDLFESF